MRRLAGASETPGPGAAPPREASLRPRRGTGSTVGESALRSATCLASAGILSLEIEVPIAELVA